MFVSTFALIEKCFVKCSCLIFPTVFDASTRQRRIEPGVGFAYVTIKIPREQNTVFWKFDIKLKRKTSNMKHCRIAPHFFPLSRQLENKF